MSTIGLGEISPVLGAQFCGATGTFCGTGGLGVLAGSEVVATGAGVGFTDTLLLDSAGIFDGRFNTITILIIPINTANIGKASQRIRLCLRSVLDLKWKMITNLFN